MAEILAVEKSAKQLSQGHSQEHHFDEGETSG
jgi:hypothetical protein